jgi:hypothetical protein
VGETTKWVLAWDFPKRPSNAFYDVYRDEFGPEVQRVQKSVAVVKDDFAARRLRALLEHYGAKVEAFAVNGRQLDDRQADQEAREFVERIHSQRLSQRGRHAGARTSHRRP